MRDPGEPDVVDVEHGAAETAAHDVPDRQVLVVRGDHGRIIGGLYRVGIDIGGTFTDLCLAGPEGIVAVGKTLTTPAAPADAVERVLAETLAGAEVAAGDVSLLVHGTTLVTNAIIERKGARTALLATRGFRDAVEIGREKRYDLYDLQVEPPAPLAPRHLRFDVPERLLADGSVAEPLDEEHVERLARELAAAGVEAVAVSFLHSFASPEHEQRAGEAIRRAAPGLRVSLSSEVVPEIREYERTSTTLANVYVQALVEDYLRDMEGRLERLGFRGRLTVMLSSGGIATVETASRFPVRMLESGPAAGALAAAAFGEAAGEPDLLSFDMGGTTAKLCAIVGGRPLVAEEFEVDRVYRLKRGSGLPVKIPVVDMIEVGVGGGSIARVSTLGTLAVGPDSAGSDPGPACYGLGGIEPTVTDADLVLGYLGADSFLGGRMALDLDAARVAIATVAEPLGLSIEDAAWGIHQVVNENMANAARVHAVERGLDPRRLPLFAFGGAGPVHALGVAAALGSPSVYAPLGAGVMSAAGFLAAPLAFDFVRTRRALLDEVDWAEAEALFAEMERAGEELLGLDEATHRRIAELRYVGQGHELRVDVPAGGAAELRAAFELRYRELYGHEGTAVPVEALNWRVVSSGPKPEVSLYRPVQRVVHTGTSPSERDVFFPGGRRPVQVVDRYALAPGTRIDGPAIVEERESTLVVPPGRTAEVTDQLAVVVT
ncbi:MAG TPA: hydantoinase/oxoprolinase family protein [Gaiellaceae bacterium]|nr:hydantoinase/oxoprolinase family protein [Gaiellaceae bacterium]